VLHIRFISFPCITLGVILRQLFYFFIAGYCCG
jgi:hypothetical protein